VTRGSAKVTRKAQVVSLASRVRAPRTYVATRRAFRARDVTHPTSMQYPETENESEQAWELLHDDPFEGATGDEPIARLVAAVAARSAAPYTELMRRLVGVDETDEREAREFFERVLEHRRALSQALGRAVHLRVAALDALTLRPVTRQTRRDSHPIIVTPSLLERAFEEATADGVTGLPQRAQFMNVLRHELRQRKRRSVCVAYVDLDRFKAVNDQYGYARGDAVLRTLAQSARGSLREGDVLARIGGDEFAILLVDVTPAEAEAALRRFRERFEALTSPLGTSFSAGLAFASPGEEAEALITRADRAMYRQKRARATASSG